ncbi:MAG: HAD hydrolase-like protein, partial [Halobacteria archaeon]|nr:HAD hydrolase-like protein [Halobacteria archaeon]
DWRSADVVGAIVIGDLGTTWDFNNLNAAFRLLMHSPQAHLVALGLTRYWQAPDGLRLDTGPFVKALEYATALEAVVMGKPARPFFETALRLLGLAANETIMIGDDIHADIDAAQHCAIPGILVRTGKFRSDDLEQGIKPHAILDSIADLPAWWQAR